MTTKLNYRVIIFGLFVILSACESRPPAKVPTVVVYPTSTTEVVYPSPAQFKSTPTPFSTLSLDRQSEFIKLILNNAECELPCLLGISPGKSSWKQAKFILERFAENKPLSPDPYASTPAVDVYFARISTSDEVSLEGFVQAGVTDDNIIQYLIFKIDLYREAENGFIDKHLSWYSASRIFEKHGPPDAVYLAYTNQSLNFGFYIIYQEPKLAVEYVGRAMLNTDRSYTICPNFGDGQILEIKLAATIPSNPVDIKTLLGHPFWTEARPFEEVSGMSLDDVYDLMINDQQPVCFRVRQP